MKRNALRWLVPALALALSAAPAMAQKELADYIQPGLKDISASADVISKNDRELEKISKGLVEAYSLERQSMQAKEPGRIRLEGRKGVFTIRYITNGDRRLTEVPNLRIREVDDVSKEPGKADSLSDIGIITQAFLDRGTGRWLRTENRGGKTLHVFEYSFTQDRKYRMTLVMDPTTKTMVEQIAHHRSVNKPGFRKRIVYSEVKQFGGVWVPTKLSLYNGENKLAGETRYDQIKINTGLPDKLFEFK